MIQRAESEKDTQRIARDFCRSLLANHAWPAILYLEGDLGAGKSVFARALLQHLGVTGSIKSPTYTLIEQYSANDLFVAHLDLYRLNDPEELYYLGFDDVVKACNLMLIEWPEKGVGQLPKSTHEVTIAYCGNARDIRIVESGSERGSEVHPATQLRS